MSRPLTHSFLRWVAKTTRLYNRTPEGNDYEIARALASEVPYLLAEINRLKRLVTP